MKKLTFALALLAAALVAAPGAATAKTKKKPKTPVFTIHGGYDKTFVQYSECDPLKQGVSKETYRTKKHYAYSGDTRRGFTIKETEQIILIRESQNPYLPSNTIVGEPSEVVRKFPGSDVIGVKKNRGTFSFDGLGSEFQRQSFSVPKKVGGKQQIKISTKEHVSNTPSSDCTVSYEDNEVGGAILITRIQ